MRESGSVKDVMGNRERDRERERERERDDVYKRENGLVRHIRVVGVSVCARERDDLYKRERMC